MLWRKLYFDRENVIIAAFLALRGYETGLFHKSCFFLTELTSEAV